MSAVDLIQELDSVEINGPALSDERVCEIIRKKSFNYIEAFHFPKTWLELFKRLAAKDTALAERDRTIEYLGERILQISGYWQEQTDRALTAEAALAEMRAELDRVKARLAWADGEIQAAKPAFSIAIKEAQHANMRLAAAEAALEQARKALAFADKQSTKVEALLEPHIQWEPWEPKKDKTP